MNFQTGGWNPRALGDLVERLAASAPALAALPEPRLLAAWEGTVEAFLDPSSPERQALDAPLAASCRLSPEGLAAGLEAVLGGVRREAALRLLAQRSAVSGPASPVLVVLASNLPALAVQPLLPALLLRRPVLLKSPGAEPYFAPAFVAALARREPVLGEAVAAVTWPGGDEALEAPVLARVGKVLAYGDAPALADLERRSPAPVVGYGPKISLAVVALKELALEEIAAGLARDIALFDQRGCLSLHAVYTAGGPAAAARLAEELAAALGRLARRWPPFPPQPAVAAAVQQLRGEAEIRGLTCHSLSVAEGTVIVEDRPELVPSPGLRTVFVHPVEDLEALPAILEPWAGRLQGAALAGAGAWRLEPVLARLGISRFAAPGDLQSPDATWHNGGFHPLAALGP